MKSVIRSFILAAFLFTALALTSSLPASAADVEINNKIGKSLKVAIMHFEEDSKRWYCEGWWIVPANSFKTIHFPKHSKPHFWVHMHNADRSWGDEKAWTVVDDRFRYPLGKQFPRGSNRRQVAFDSHNIGQDGKVRVTAK